MPAFLIVCYVVAAALCFAQGDPKRATYWIAAAVLNWTVTF
jgi:hypothetical protein